MIVTTRVVGETLFVIFITPPYVKDAATWAEATLLFKPATQVERKTLPTYDFSFPSAPDILQDVKNANGNDILLRKLVNTLNKLKPCPTRYQLFDAADFQRNKFPECSLMESETNAIPLRGLNHEENYDTTEAMATDALPVQLLLSRPESRMDDMPSKFMRHEIKNIVKQRLAQQLKFLGKGLNQTDKLPPKHKSRQRKDSKDSSSSLSSSSSSSASSTENLKSEDVGKIEEEKVSGYFKCPFSRTDNRAAIKPKNLMKGKAEERKYLRSALHSFYNEYTSLKAYVDSLRSSMSSAVKPYSSDLLCLAHHVTYLDTLLLKSYYRPWHLWNELGIDYLPKAFLELVVRVSPNRSYLDILDERVRKWMKRNRILISLAYGPVPFFLSDAKITDSGIQPKNGCDSSRIKELKKTSGTGSFASTKANSGIDKGTTA